MEDKDKSKTLSNDTLVNPTISHDTLDGLTCSTDTLESPVILRSVQGVIACSQPESPTSAKDFIYVDDADCVAERKSLCSMSSAKKNDCSSDTSSYSEVQSLDLEPKMGKNEHGQDVSKLVAEAQMDDFFPQYYNEERDGEKGDEAKAHSLSDIDIQVLDSTSDSENGIGDQCDSTDDAGDACISFHNVTYLGSTTINASVSDLELRKSISILRDNTAINIDIILAIGISPNGNVRLIDPASRTDIATYCIGNICFWGRGDRENREKDCLAFNISHGKEEPTYHCHVFKCAEEDNVTRILQSLATTVKKDKKRKQLEYPSRPDTTFDVSNLTFKFNVTIDIWEEDGKGSYQQVARDRNHFKLRKELQRKVVLIIEQTSNKRLKIEKCFGLLLAQGRDVPEQDFHLLLQIQQDDRPGGRCVISGHWDPNTDQWKLLNTDTGKDNRIYMTVAADIIFRDLKEPVRILKEAKVRIFSINEKFWNPTKPKIQEEYVLQLKENSTELGEKYFEKESLLSATDISKAKGVRSNSISAIWKASKNAIKRTTTDDNEEPTEMISPEDEDVDDEPLLSGSGEVAAECSEEELASWNEILLKWKDVESRPSKMFQLVRKGVPQSLRGQVWQKMIGIEDYSELLNSYSYLTKKDSPQEQVILWDVTRTFPGNDYFREAGGEGQKALYNISKAYSVYDEEVGYCQGLSFLIAVFLLQVPEEQAYCLLVNVMYEYGHRDNFKDKFEVLHQSFYVLHQLLEGYMPDLFHHFQSINVEIHMFASQWLLTMFTAKFPLSLVNHFIDLILCQGCDVMFQISLALLKDSKKELMLLDFEGVLKYFRVNLPKKYMDESHRKELFNNIYSFKVSKKRLETYREEYLRIRDEIASKEDPLDRLQRENQRMHEENQRLERENDSLAYEIVTTQVTMQEVITDLEDKVNILTKETEKHRKHLLEGEEEIERLKIEEGRVKAMWRDSMLLADTEKATRDRIIEDYKQILTNLEARNEKITKDQAEDIRILKRQIDSCETCSAALLNGVQNGEEGNDETMSPKDVTSSLLKRDDSEEQMRNLEAELIQTKVALAEEKDRADELGLRLHNLTAASDKPWYKNFTINNKR